MKSLLLILLLQATGPTNQYDLMDIVHFPANGAPWWMVHVNNNSTISFSPQYTPTMAASDLWSQSTLDCTQSSVLSVWKADNSDFLVNISNKGVLTYGKSYVPDAHAKNFWAALAKALPCPRK
jgi:hypothetical protein